ncbi:hypothetical protein [Shouchella tritolerans]|uniref:hypothetical protein n=1 Tax=Shouchella tritolerans TaxID=2979466 RepID=UPI0007899A30|nr:hypothetical protein [Shouchella tritolerans]
MKWQNILLESKMIDFGLKIKTTVKERIKAFRIIYEHNYGTAVDYSGNDELLVEKAIRNSVSFPKNKLDFYPLTKSEQLDNDRPKQLGVGKYLIFNLFLKNEQNISIEEKTFFQINACIINEKKLINAKCSKEKIFEHPWVISPLALSKIILNEWSSILRMEKKSFEFPCDIKIIDRATKMKYDFEGTLKQETLFVSEGEVINYAYNLEKANGNLDLLNGQGGINGIFLTDLYLISNDVSPWPDFEFYYVEDVHSIKNNMFLVTFRNVFNKNIELVKINKHKLFTNYEWLEERGRGIFPWNVPYLLIKNPYSIK